MKGGKSNLIAMSLYLPSYGVTLPVIWSFLLPSALPLALKKHENVSHFTSKISSLRFRF
jgi:hypothetical protein